MTTNSPHAGPTHKAVEAGVTLLIALFGGIVIYRQREGRHQLGRGRTARRFLPLLYRNLHRRLQRDQSLARVA